MWSVQFRTICMCQMLGAIIAFQTSPVKRSSRSEFLLPPTADSKIKAHSEVSSFPKQCFEKYHTSLFATNDIDTDNGSATTSTEENNEKQLDPDISSQFKILTCSATSCRKRQKAFGLDEFDLLAGLYERKEAAAACGLIVEQSSCLGSCKHAPCVGVEHEDYFGTVALEGMTEYEFNDSVFHNIVTEDDLDRVWSAVENAIEVMAAENEEEE